MIDIRQSGISSIRCVQGIEAEISQSCPRECMHREPESSLIAKKMGYAQVLSIDLLKNGDFYSDRLCGEDEGYAEELIKHARTDDQCALERMPFHEIGNKSLFPS